MWFKIVCVMLFVVSFVAGCVEAFDDLPLVVNTNFGAVQGFYSENSRIFKAIPFAKPPIGDLRYVKSVPPEAWTGVRDATIHPPVCPQHAVTVYLPLINQTHIFEEGYGGGVDEDCLYLNIYTPKSGLSVAKYPVIVYLHGGGIWDGGTDLDEPIGLSNRGDVIVVTVAYRLNTLSNLVLPGKEAEMSNSWFGDQTLALKWVKENIEYFGGDRSRVTLNGHSIGGASAIFHMMTDESQGLYDTIVLMNPGGYEYHSMAQTHAKSLAWAAAAPRNCTGTSDQILACLRALPWQVAEQGFSNSFYITIGGGSQFEQAPLSAIRDGNYNKNVKVMLGYTTDSGTIYSAAFQYLATSQLFGQGIIAGPESPYFGAQLFQILNGIHFSTMPLVTVTSNITVKYAEVASQPGSNYWLAFSQMMQDHNFMCGGNYIANKFAEDGLTVYRYLFDHAPVHPIGGYTFLKQAQGTDPSYWFNWLGKGAPQYVAEFSDDEKRLNELLGDWLVNMARFGNPMKGWKSFKKSGSSENNYLTNLIRLDSLDGTDMARVEGSPQICEFWFDLWANYPGRS